jgi:hypothetical protein
LSQQEHQVANDLVFPEIAELDNLQLKERGKDFVEGALFFGGG